MSQTYRHDSFLGGLNLLKWRDHRLFFRGERPPYPIIIDNPTVTQAFQNLNFADFGILCFFTLLGFPAGRSAARYATASEYLRRTSFNAVWWGTIVWGSYIAMMNSYYRLQGYVDNGLRWKRVEKKIYKYDFTSDYEKKTFYGFFTIRDE